MEEPFATVVGKKTNFSEIYESLGPRVSGFFLRRTDGRQQLAEDFTQDVFEKVLRELNSFEDRGVPFTAWVFRIARNRLVNHSRSQRREDLFGAPAKGKKLIQVLAPPSDIPDSDENIASIAVHELLDSSSLTDGQRRTIELRFLEGCNILETAETMGKTVAEVKQLQKRGLANLKKGLNP